MKPAATLLHLLLLLMSLSVSLNLQQVFSGSSSVYLSCVDDGQTADGWTVKRTRGNLTEDCGAAGSGFSMKFGSSCFVDLSAPSETFWCEDSSGQQSDRVSFSVQSETKEKNVILEIPALPVRTGSDVILLCRQRNGATVAAYFFINGHQAENKTKPQHIITNITQADEGLYSCSTDEGGNSPQSSLRVRDPPTIIHPPPPHYPPPPHCPPPPSSLLAPAVAGLVSVVLLVLVLFLCWKLNGVCVLLLSALTVSAAPPPPCQFVLRLFSHLVVFSPYCISTGLLLSICCSRKTTNKPAVSMEMTQRDGGAAEGGAPVMTPPSAGCGTNQTSQKTFLCFQPVVELLAGQC
ncbi:unnamed protein product [Oreochromis niloticus]|nr:unnamed protein product [Mustela putorius furo]